MYSRNASKMKLTRIIAAGISTLAFVTAAVSPVSAAIDQCVLTDGNGNTFAYSLPDLRQSFLDEGALYASFNQRVSSGYTLFAFRDDKSNRYIDYKSIRNMYLDNPVGFDANKEVEKDTAPLASFKDTVKSFKEVKVNNAGAAEDIDESIPSDTSAAVQVKTYHSAELVPGITTVTLTLDVQDQTMYEVTVMGQKLQYDAANQCFTGDIAAAKSLVDASTPIVNELQPSSDSPEVVDIQ